MRNLDEALSFSHLTFDDEGLITSQQNLSGSHAIETYGNTYAFKSRNCYVLYSPDENDLRVVTNDGNYLPSRGPERMDLLAAETLNGKTYILIGNSISGLKQCELSPTGEILREHDLQPIEVSGDTLTYKRRDTVVTLDTTSGEFLYLKNLGSDVPPSDYLYLEKVVSTDKFATKSGKISGRINNYLGRTGSIERLALWEAKSGRHHLWRMDDNWDNVERVSMSDIDTEGYLRVFKENDYIWISERGTGDFGVLTNENNKPISAQKYRDIGYISMASESVLC